tara:strand:+ start:2036 stop:2449 length:414 start_codon:yes stop_codon:yes gene_type:complete
MKTTLTVGSSFENKLKQLDALALGGVKEKLEDIARTAVDYSPVETGAYVTSFSYTIGAGRPRGKSSTNLPKGASLENERETGYANLVKDISRIKDIEDLDNIQLRNGSPHAYDVEYGENWSKTDGYFVFTKLENIYG